MVPARPDALVIGAGVIGLSTGIRLAEAGLRVRIVAESPPEHTTSAAASAVVGPTFAPPGDRMRDWERATVEELAPLSADGSAGVHLTTGQLVARGADQRPPFLDDLPGVRLCRADELPPGFGFGFWLRLPLVDMPRYLAHLRSRFAASGGEIELRRISSLRAAAGEAPLVANCAGIGARDLVPDPSVIAVRGQHVIVENPGLDTFFLEAPLGPAWAGWFPHGAHVVLGGTATEGDDNLTPDPGMAAEIVRRCAEVEPRLRTARVIGHRVGLRPARPTVRLEAQEIDGTRVVHNYGHGGVGVTLSWGCARDAVMMLLA